MANDILLNEQNDLKFLNGDFMVGESDLQEVALLLPLSQGELKMHPILGPNLTQLINGTKSRKEFERRVKLHLEIDGKNYDDIKELVQTKFKTH